MTSELSLVMRQADMAFKSSDLNERHYTYKSEDLANIGFKSET